MSYAGAYKQIRELITIAMIRPDAIFPAEQDNQGIKISLTELISFLTDNSIIGGDIAEDQVAFGSDQTNSVEGEAALTWDGATLRITGTIEADLIKFAGGMQMHITSIASATYTLLKSDQMVFFNTTSQASTATLPAITDIPSDDGRMFRIQKFLDSTNALTVSPQAPSKINNETTDTVIGLKNDNCTYLAFGGNWFIINRDTAAFGAIELATPGATQGITGTLTKLAIFDTDRFTTPGITTADHTTDVITINHIESLSLGGDGFSFRFRLEISGYSNNQDIGAEVFVNGVPTNVQDVRGSSVNLNTVLEAEGLFQVAAGNVDVEIRIVASNVETATFETAQLIVERIAK